MSDTQMDRQLTDAEKREFDADTQALEASSIPSLAGRLQYGLDPASMMEVPKVKELSAAIIQALAKDADPEAQGRRWTEVQELIHRLHKEGPWGFVDRLKQADASDPAISGMKRVPLGAERSRTVWVNAAEATGAIETMKPAAKRIGGGYVLAYDNRTLALRIAARCLAQ